MSRPPLTLGGLPGAVRTRVVALAADALPDVVRLPPALRRVAGFAPQRRARLGGSAIAAALEADDELRERVGTQVAARTSYDADALPGLAGGDEGADPAEVAAAAWLVRPEGWEEVLHAAADRLRERPDAVEREAAEVARLRDKLADAEQAVRDLRARNRAQVDEYKNENASLRRKLGESRAAERAARAALEEQQRAVEEAQRTASAQAAGQDKELRRLRAQVAQLEAEASADRRAARSDRDEASLRARLLLDTVIDAASGLRRELALPSVEGAPGDRVEADLVRAGAARAGATAAASSSPALLERVLGMPRARLIVDGYNVSKTAWPTSPLEAQRIRLLAGLAPLVARLGVETTVVFDAAAASARTVAQAPRGVKVVFSPEGVIADDVIRDLVAAEPSGRVVAVVSSDREVATDVARAGARSHSAEALIGLLS
ncbi:NYN domain-containing protein [Nocardioides koreensis]|uniref:NYN domain-containing protein n=1 Tax=Nocardioides koreensis TaxID=433651 RepID=A0ABP5LNF7_9ACTN